MQLPNRPSAIAWAASIMADPTTVFLDTETTGRLKDKPDIIDIAVISVAGEVLLNTLVIPEKPIPAEATKIHGITNEMVVGAAYWGNVHAELDWLLSGSPVVVWNAEFDFTAINQHSKRYIRPEFPGPWDCAMKAYGAFVGELSKYAKQSTDWRYWKQDEAAASFGIERDGHRAAADAEVCRRIVQAMALEDPLFSPKKGPRS